MFRRRVVSLSAVIFLAACNSAPTAPTPPTGHLLTTAVWPGESVLVVSPEAAARPDSVTVTAGTDTLAFTVADDSTLAVPIADSSYSTDLALTVHTPGGFVDVGTVHVYGYVGSSGFAGLMGMAVPFPGAAVAPSVALFDSTGPVVLNVETGAKTKWPGPGPLTCDGLGPSYRASDGWIASCQGAYRLAQPTDSAPYGVNGSFVAEIGPQTLLSVSKYEAWTWHVDATGATSVIVDNGWHGIDGVHHLVLSPDGSRATYGGNLVAGADSAAPGLPVFAADGRVAFTLFDSTRINVAATFSPSGDTLYVAAQHGGTYQTTTLWAFAAAGGSLLDSVVVETSAPEADEQDLYADAASGLLYSVRIPPFNGNPVLLDVMDRRSLRPVATAAGDPACVGSLPAVIVTAPAHHALYIVSSGSYGHGVLLGTIRVCEFDVP